MRRLDTAIQFPEAFRELFTPSRYKAYYGGRGGAKSHSFATALLIRAAKETLRILCSREIQVSIRDSVKRLLDDKIALLEMGNFYKSTQTEITALNGSMFVFYGLRTDPDKIKSMEGIDIAWIEEANTVSKRSLELLIPTIRKQGSEIWVSWNPRHKTDPVEEMFRGPMPPPNAIIREVSWRDNPWVTDELTAEMEWDQKRDPEKYAHVWLGEHVRHSEARVFRNWRIGAEDEFIALENARYHYGADWGFSVDPTVLVRSRLDGRTLYVDYEAYKVGCEIDKTPELFAKVPGSSDWPIIADSARPETISWMQRHGYPRILPAKKGPGSVEEGITFLQSLDIVVHPRCKHVIDELTLYAWKMDKQTGEILPILEDRANHTIDALRYSHEGSSISGIHTISAGGNRQSVKAREGDVPSEPATSAPRARIRGGVR